MGQRKVQVSSSSLSHTFKAPQARKEHWDLVPPSTSSSAAVLRFLDVLNVIMRARSVSKCCLFSGLGHGLTPVIETSIARFPKSKTSTLKFSEPACDCLDDPEKHGSALFLLMVCVETRELLLAIKDLRPPTVLVR